LLLASVVQISVEVKHLAPSKVDLINMAMHLLAHIYKVLPAHRIVKHDDPPRFLPALVCEVCRLLSQVLNLLCLFRTHHLKCCLLVSNDVLSLTLLLLLNLPFRNIVHSKYLLFLGCKTCFGLSVSCQ
jgi:hypothetical protein